MRATARRAGWLAATVVAAAASAGCAAEEYRELVVGECLPAEAELIGIREHDPPSVPCDEPHRYEVYATPLLEDRATWPGGEAVDAEAERRCFELFEEEIGVPLVGSPYEMAYVVPSRSSWGDGDRLVTCLVIQPDDRPGSARVAP